MIANFYTNLCRNTYGTNLSVDPKSFIDFKENLSVVNEMIVIRVEISFLKITKGKKTKREE